MQATVKDKYAIINLAQPLFAFSYSGSCEIGNEGIKHLAKAHWPRILNLNLSKSMRVI